MLPPSNDKSDSIIFKDIDLAEWMPTVPDSVRKDEYLEKIGIINQEWNRQQVSFTKPDFQLSGNWKEKELATRIDLARNCLNACLWEVIAYTNEDGSNKPYYHGWFSFPEKQYKMLFEERNNMAYDKWGSYLTNWKDPESRHINLSLLRQVLSEKELTFKNLNDQFYPLQGERKKKFRNIIVPANPKTINDFLTDSTTFATFSPPGYYTRADPRKTELSRLYNPIKVVASQTIGNGKKGEELNVYFQRRGSEEITRLVVGGINMDSLPVLTDNEVNNGWQMPMGIANHTFYESYAQAQKNASKKSSFYALMLTKDGNFLDSHKVGIDGPLLYRDARNPNILHLWILAFERHAFVGHLAIEM